jgi:biopolymer transport protein ExbD
MKTMKYPLLLSVLAIGLCADLLAQEYPQVALCIPGGSKTPVNREEYIILVVEGDFLTYEKNQIPNTGVVDYVNQLLSEKKVSYIGLCAREGTRFKDLIRAVDLLRGTKATNIGISVKELPAGREP